MTDDGLATSDGEIEQHKYKHIQFECSWMRI